MYSEQFKVLCMQYLTDPHNSRDGDRVDFLSVVRVYFLCPVVTSSLWHTVDSQ